MLGLGTVAVIGALGTTPAAEAPAPSSGVVLEWTAPEGCPTGEHVQAWLDRALADSPADPAGMAARATVQTSADGRLTLDLTLTRSGAEAGRRVMEASDCGELAKAAVLIVALAVDPDATVETLPEEADAPPEPEPEPPEVQTPEVPAEPERPAESPPAEPEPKPEPEPEPPAEPIPADQPPPPDRTAPPDGSIHVGLRAQGAAGLSVLPSPTAAVSLMAAIWGPRWRAELGATVWTPVDSRPDGTAGGRIHQWTIDARGCGVLRPGPLELPLCGGLDVGAVHGIGRGVLDPRRVASLRLAVALGPALVWRPERLDGRLGLWLGADVLVALVRARFRATPASTDLVYYTPPVGGRVGAGIEVRFR